MLEIAWLLVAIALLVTAFVIYFAQTPEGSYLFFILATISAVMYLLRRRRRIKRLNIKQH